MTTDDEHNDELTTAFAEFRHHATGHFTATDTTQIYTEAKTRRTRTRNFSIAAALLAATGMLTAGIVLQSPPPAGEREPLSTGQPWTPTSEQPTPPATPPTAKATRPDLANLVRFLDEEHNTRLRNSTITLPPWPTQAQGCPAGTYTFHDGKAPTGERDQIGRPYDYLLLFRDSLGIHADLDRVPGDEIVIPMACGFTEVTYQLLVLRDGRGGLTALGYLPALPDFDRFYPYGEGLVVEVLNHPFDTIAEQRRRYGWNGTRFVQTHGPKTFPANLTPDVRRTDLRQSYFHVEQCGGGMLSFYDGVSGTWPTPDHPATLFELGEISTGLLREPAGPASHTTSQGDALVTVTCRPAGQTTQTWVVKVSAANAVPVLKVGDDGVTGIVSHRISGGLAELVVQTGTGRQTWRYRSDGHTLTRVP